MATNNNDLPVRVYSKQFLQLLSTVYQSQSVFMPTFGALQALDGISNNAVARIPGICSALRGAEYPIRLFRFC